MTDTADVNHSLRRRTFLVTSGLGAATALAGCSTGLSGSDGGGGTDSTGGAYVEGTRLVTEDGSPVGVDAIPDEDGSELTVYPEQEGGGAMTTKDATTLLVRFPPDAYESPTKTEWTTKGYAAYSEVCTHAGCLVTQRADEGGFYCPCHGSTYDPRKGASVVDGPATRALPQLPLGLTDAGTFVVATGSFEEAVGP